VWNLKRQRVEAENRRGEWKKWEDVDQRVQSFSQAWWLMPIIPATWEVKIMRIMVQSQSRQKAMVIPYQLTC
jgi:hypothetical protein